MNKLLLIFLFIVINFLARSQTTSCYFLKDTGTAEIETSSSVVELNDGTIYVAGAQGNGPNGADDIALLKFDACGNVLWIKYFGDSLNNEALYINKTWDQKLIMVGQTGTQSNGSDIFFYILDSSGTIQFQKLYGDSLEQMAKYVEQTSDKGFVFCGYTTDAAGSNDTYAVKIDSAGNEKWHIQVGGPLPENGDAIHELADGNYLLTGDTKSFGSGGTDVEVVKCDKNGNIIWDKTYGDNLENGCQGIIEMSNGKYLSFGETNIPSSVAFDFFIEMLDTNGSVISRHTFGGTASDALFSLVEVPGMEFMCTGYSRSFNGFSAYDVVLFKVDTAGQMKWLKNITSPGIDIGYKIIPSVNGDYLITGLFADNNGNYFLIHSDTVGNTNVDMKSFSVQNELSIYPNPFNSKISVNTFSGHYKKIEIFNLTGIKMGEFTREGTDEQPIDLSYLSSGQYIIRVITNEGILNKKITKE
jgi:hypothetical protein